MLIHSALLTASLVTLASDAGSSAAIPRRPDIILVVLDDLDKVVSDPFVERIMEKTTALRSQGVTFDFAFTQTSICCPARATILTGKCGHNTGVLTNGGPTGGWTTFRKNGLDDVTIARTLEDAGYRTVAIGKYMNQYEFSDGKAPPVPAGWTQWDVIVDAGIKGYRGYNFNLLHHRSGDAKPTVVPCGDKEKDYSTDVFRDIALKFIDDESARQPQAPLFIYLAPTAPHLPLPAAPRHQAQAAKWKGSLPTKRPNFFSDGETVADKPAWLRDSWRKRQRGILPRFTERDWNDRLGSLYAVDEMVAAIVERQKARGRWEDTLLIIVSDNGYNLGAHALVHKMAPYEESIRVPLMIVGGANAGLRSGEHESRWATLADLAPTVLDFAGLPANNDMDGASLGPLLRRGAPPPPTWRTAMLLEYDGGGAANGFGVGEELRGFVDLITPAVALDVPSYRGLRARVAWQGAEHTWKYVEWPTGERELYNLDTDPYELNNLLAGKSSTYQELATALHQKLEALKTCRGASCR
ncbi:MAG: sulfatase [Myxococcota bacterium]